MDLSGLLDLMRQQTAYKTLSETLDGAQTGSTLGLIRSARPYVTAALADRYFMRRIPPAWFRPSAKIRIEFAEKLAKDYSVDGIIWYNLLYRDSYDIQYYYFEKALDKDLGLKTLKILSDYDTSEVVPLKTRIEAFVETLRR